MRPHSLLRVQVDGPYGPWERGNCIAALAMGGRRAGRTGQGEEQFSHAHAQSNDLMHHLVRRLRYLPQRLFAEVNQALTEEDLACGFNIFWGAQLPRPGTVVGCLTLINAAHIQQSHRSMRTALQYSTPTPA